MIYTQRTLRCAWAAILMFVLTIVGCDTSVAPDGTSSTPPESAPVEAGSASPADPSAPFKHTPSSVIQTPSGDSLAKTFYDRYGEIVDTEVVQTPNGPLTRLITSKMEAPSSLDAMMSAKATSVPDCISDEREIQVGYRGQANDEAEALRGYVMTGLGVNIGGGSVVNVVVEARKILPSGDFGRPEHYCSGSNCSTEQFAYAPDDYVVYSVGLDNDGRDLDSIDLCYRKIDWNTFETVDGTEFCERTGNNDSPEVVLSLLDDAQIVAEQANRIFFRTLGAGTWQDAFENDFYPDDMAAIWGEYSLYDAQCLRDLE